jgi:CBS domain containing-hemolysin-like protein
VAAALSLQSLLLSQGSPGLLLNAAAALGLLASLVVIDRAAHLAARRYAPVAGALSAPLLRLLRAAPLGGATATGNGATEKDEEHEGGAEPTDSTTLVITEEGPATLDDRERLMIRSILQLDETTARQVMVPRVNMVAVEADTPLPEVARCMMEHGHSRLPVFRETTDQIVGVVYSRDLLPFLSKTDTYPPLQEIVRPAFFIPESKRLDDLLRELQEKQVQMAIVVDEYGGVEGLVTLEDLLEEIVGEIEDEFSRGQEPRVVPVANGEFIADAEVSLEELSDLFSSPIVSENVDTVGGLLYATLDKMPQVGDQVVYNGLRIEVLALLGRRVRKLKISRSRPEEADVA